MGYSKVLFPFAEEKLTRWSLLLGVTIWFIDLNTVYALPSVACEWNWFPFTIAGIPGLKIIEGLITIVSMLLMALMIYWPWRNWRAFQTQKPSENPQLLSDSQKDHRALMAFVAMLTNSFFLLFIIAFFVPMLALNACMRG